MKKHFNNTFFVPVNSMTIAPGPVIWCDIPWPNVSMCTLIYVDDILSTFCELWINNKNQNIYYILNVCYKYSITSVVRKILFIYLFILMCNISLKPQNKLISGLWACELCCLLSCEEITLEFFQSVLNLLYIRIYSITYHHTLHAMCTVVLWFLIHYLLIYLLTYFLTYSVEQSPSWEANWFCT